MDDKLVAIVEKMLDEERETVSANFRARRIVLTARQYILEEMMANFQDLMTGNLVVAASESMAFHEDTYH